MPYEIEESIQLYSVPVLTNLLGVSRTTLFDQIRKKKLIASKLGRRTVFQHAHVLAYLESLPTTCLAP